MSRRHRIFALVAGVALALDQLTKAWARDRLAAGKIVVIRDYFDLHLAFNPGVAFSLFDESNARWILAGIALLACAIVVWVVHKRAKDSAPWSAAGLGMVFAGALGNGLDRITRGMVTDFVVWKWTDAHRWPHFNVADAALGVGVVLLFLADLRRKKA